jgi:hypothetical protein
VGVVTAPTLFRRQSADVQAMRLESWRDVSVSRLWLATHGVRSAWSGKTAGPLLVIYGPHSRTTARLGDWLTYDVGSGVFAVEADDGGKPSGHTKVEGEG